MGLSCGGHFLKFLVFFFNAIVFLGGGVMAGYGIYLLVEAQQTGGAVSVAFPACITAFGLLLFLVGFLGCFGACYNNSCMLITFAVIVGLLLVAEIVCGILLLVYRHDFVRVFGNQLTGVVKDYESGLLTASDPSIKALYEMQKDLKCCGGNGPQDWTKPPQSCCDTSNDCASYYSKGCAQALYDEVKDSALVVGIIIMVIALIQIGAIICAACLAKKVNEGEGV